MQRAGGATASLNARGIRHSANPSMTRHGSQRPRVPVNSAPGPPPSSSSPGRRRRENATNVRYRRGGDTEYTYRQRIAKLSGKRRNGREPLELELIVLFLSIAIILLIPWLLHDARFILLVPMTFLVVPGLCGVLLKATSELFGIVVAWRRKEKKRRQEERARTLRMRREGRAYRYDRGRREPVRRLTMEGVVKTGVRLVGEFAAFWRGFL